MLHTYPNTELKSCDSEAISGAESRLEVGVEAALHVDDVHLKGEGHPVVGVLGPLGVVLAPVEVELEDLVILGKGSTTEDTLTRARHVDVKLLKIIFNNYLKKIQINQKLYTKLRT